MPPCCQRTHYGKYSDAARWSLWAIVTFLCLYASSTWWFKVPCKGLSHPSRVEKKHATDWGAALLSDASTKATLCSPALQLSPSPRQAESLEQCTCLPEEHVKQRALPQHLVPWLQASMPSNTTPAALETGELHQRTMHPGDSLFAAGN